MLTIVTIVNEVEIRCPRNRDSFPAEIQDVSLLHCVKSGYAAQQALRSLDDGRFSLGVKRQRRVPLSNVEVKSE
jgi:hypothetical protein